MSYIYIFGAAVLMIVTAAPASHVCDNGWVQYKESCFYTERETRASFDDAERHCSSMKAKLFLPNTIAEFKDIIREAPINDWTWTGLSKKAEDKSATFAEGSKDAIDFHEMNWLNRPYGHVLNGWTSAAQCAAHYNHFAEVTKYVFWYPCTYNYFYICERNFTLSH